MRILDMGILDMGILDMGILNMGIPQNKYTGHDIGSLSQMMIGQQEMIGDLSHESLLG